MKTLSFDEMALINGGGFWEWLSGAANVVWGGICSAAEWVADAAVWVWDNAVPFSYVDQYGNTHFGWAWFLF